MQDTQMYIIPALTMSLWASFVYIFESSTKFSCHIKDRYPGESAVTTLVKTNKFLLYLAFARWGLFVSIE